MNKSKIITIIIFVGIIGIATVLFLLGDGKIRSVPVPDNSWKNYPLDIIPAETYPTNLLMGHSSDLENFSILPNTKVSEKKIIQGVVKSNYFFEGNIGVNILGNDKKLLRSGHATAVGEWASPDPVKFQGELDFSGLVKGPAFIEIHNDNPTGLPENDKSILVPVVIE